MSAELDEQRRLRPITVGDFETLMAIETAAYPHPWSRGNFADSLAAGYLLQALCTPDGEWLGYLVAMSAADELHLLNLAVVPSREGQGHGRFLLDALCRHGRNSGATQLWLEVRQSNARALALYLRYGFHTIGTRRGYYPAADGRREDATVMSLSLEPIAPARHALD